MDASSIVCVLIGLLIIVSRGPLIIAPGPTIDFYERLVSTDARVRLVGCVVAAVSAALLAAPPARNAPAFWFEAFGGLLALVALWLLAWPKGFRRLADGVFSFARDSVDAAIVRGLGAAAVALGAWLVYVGIKIL